MFKVTHNDYDPDLATTYYYNTAEDVFLDMADNILEDLEDNDYDVGELKERFWQKLYKAIKSKKWEKLIGPANEYLYECGNGNSYDVCEIDEIEIEKPRQSMEEILNRAEKANRNLQS